MELYERYCSITNDDFACEVRQNCYFLATFLRETMKTFEYFFGALASDPYLRTHLVLAR